MAVSGLTESETRAYNYAVESGRALGYLRSIHGRLSTVMNSGLSDAYRLEVAQGTYTRLTEILAEIDPEGGTDYGNAA